MNWRKQQIVASSLMVATTLACGCAESGRAVPHVPGPMASALLAFAAQQGVAAEEVAQTWKTLDAIAARVDARHRGPGQDAIDNMNTVVFTELGFTREVASTDPAFLLLPSVVKNHRGGCVGLSALYLALAERLDIPLAGVLVPGHFFVRVSPPRSGPAAQQGLRARNVELLRQGQAMPDDWYIRKYGPFGNASLPPTPTATTTEAAATTPATASAYLRPLEIAEVIAVHWFNVGNQRRGAGDVTGASDAYSRAANEFPAFAEAVASFGAVRHLQGDLQTAALSYGAAARVRPDLPGLAHNLAVLDAERGARPRPPRPSAVSTRENESGELPRRSLP